MLMGTSQQLSYLQPIQLCLDSHVIARVKTSKYLGVTLDTNLSWTSHVDKLHSKVSARIGVLKRIRLSLTFQSTAKRVCNTAILPLFDYTVM